MKRIVSFAAILILIINMAACSTGAGSGTKAGTKAPASYGTAGGAASGADNKPQISIYYLMSDSFVTNAIMEFKSKFKDVNVVQNYYYLNSIDNRTNDDFTKSISTEILTGGGPDIIVCSPLHDIDSISKMFSNDAFSDLNDLIAKDNNFKLDDYNKNIMDAGMINGRREFIPIYYVRQFFYTTESILKQNDIKINEDCSVMEFSKIVDEFVKNKNRKCKYLFGSEHSTFNFFYLLNLYGEKFYDFSNKKGNFDSSEFKDLLRLYKKMQPLIATDEAEKKYDYLPIKLLKNNITAMVFDSQGSLSNMHIENCYVNKEMNENLKMIKISGSEKAQNLKPIITNIAAINNNCKNKEYAFEFIKMLLSDPIQRKMYSESPGGLNTVFNPLSFSTYKKDLDSYTVNFKNGETTGWNSYSVDSIPLTDALAKRITDINNKMDKPIFMDKSIKVIIDEAVKDYLSGKKDENQTAQLINDKVELFLNE